MKLRLSPYGISTHERKICVSMLNWNLYVIHCATQFQGPVTIGEEDYADTIGEDTIDRNPPANSYLCFDVEKGLRSVGASGPFNALTRTLSSRE